MQRYLNAPILEDSAHKIVLISGPRQCGKTTLTKRLFQDYVYLNYDLAEDRQAIRAKQWLRTAKAIIFDELHKMPRWKRWLKGIYDTEGLPPCLLVTGSANLDQFKKVGDSLAGRYFQFRLHPLDLKEAMQFWTEDPKTIFNRLMNCSGFPEPFLKGELRFYRRWRQTHLNVILRQDFLDLYAVRSIQSIELLVDLLKTRVGSSVVYSHLAQDLQVDHKTIKNWLQLLENFYVVFKVKPYHKNIVRSLLKEPKYYFFDIARVQDLGARLENLVACALLKEIHRIEDLEGLPCQLCYLKTKNGQEIDFLVVVDDKPVLCFEVKTSDTAPSKAFKFFKEQLKLKHCIQLVLNIKREFDTNDGVRVCDLISFLTQFDLMDYLSI